MSTAISVAPRSDFTGPAFSFFHSDPSRSFLSVGALGIEPNLHAPEACVLPVYYAPRITSHSISFSSPLQLRTQILL